jgi:hypothetical protein
MLHDLDCCLDLEDTLVQPLIVGKDKTCQLSTDFHL